MYEAYNRIFERCELDFRAVAADSGNIGGDFSHEFMVIADTGEDILMTSTKSDYAANIELAEIGERENFNSNGNEELRPVNEVHTPGLKTVDEVAKFLNSTADKLIKTMIVETDKSPVVALVRGDAELSLIKIRKAINADFVNLGNEDTIREVTGGPLGFSGPVEIQGVKIIADRSVKNIVNGITGANKPDYHLVGVNPDRDFKIDLYGDIRVAKDGDPCPVSRDGVLKSIRGIEVGHVFKLGTKYSESMNATFVDADGKENHFIMGCYGIGIGRTVAAAIEQNYDDHGMIFPISIAPFEVTVLPLNLKDDRVKSVSEDIYQSLLERWVDVLIDDRNESAGFKFKDAELLGIPIQVAVGPRTLKDNAVEIKLRKDGSSKIVKIEDVTDEVESILNYGVRSQH